MFKRSFVALAGCLILPASRWYLTLILPVLLALISVRLVMTPLFLHLVYHRPGFPTDYYGFTTQDRLEFAPYALDYLLNDADIDYLSALRFADGKAMYTVRELQHMRDVKLVTQAAFALAVINGIASLSVTVWLVRTPATRVVLKRALRQGSLLTLVLLASIIVVAVVNWDFFFTTFHTLFFAEGTWRFAYSDTLIRLFPEQFWFEAALTIGLLMTVQALLILFICRRWPVEYDI